MRWSSKTLSLFQTSLDQLILSNEESVSDRQSSLWRQLQSSVLLSSDQLGEKYNRLMEASKAEEGDVGEGEEKEEEKSFHERKITE